MHIRIEQTSINWVYLPIEKVKFNDIQKAIYEANSMTCPIMKKNAWKKVYLLSEQYKKQEILEIK